MANKAKVIKWNDMPEQDFGTVRTRALLDCEDSPNLSLSWVYKQKAPVDRMSKSDNCDMAYFIISGTGSVLINGEEISIEKGDVVYVPKGAEYRMSDGLETIAACNPRFGR